MTDTFLRLPKVKQLTGFGRSQIYLLIKQGKFPKQIHIGPKSVAWLDSEVSEWMKERIRLSRNDDNPGSITWDSVSRFYPKTFDGVSDPYRLLDC